MPLVFGRRSTTLTTSSRHLTSRYSRIGQQFPWLVSADIITKMNINRNPAALVGYLVVPLVWCINWVFHHLCCCEVSHPQHQPAKPRTGKPRERQDQGITRCPR